MQRPQLAPANLDSDGEAFRRRGAVGQREDTAGGEGSHSEIDRQHAIARRHARLMPGGFVRPVAEMVGEFGAVLGPAVTRHRIDIERQFQPGRSDFSGGEGAGNSTFQMRALQD
jgi:hypothetical protein